MSEDQTQAAPARWADTATTNLGAVIAAASAVAYLIGYVQLGAFTTTLGVPQSSIGLDFREYVILALANLAWIAALAAAYRVGQHLGQESGRAVYWLGGAAIVLGVASGNLPPSTHPAAVLVAYVAITALAAAAIGTGIEDRVELVLALAMLGLVLYGVVFEAASRTTSAAVAARSGDIQASGTTLDLVIRPLPMVLLESEAADLSSGYEGTEVVLVSNRGGQAVYVQDQSVVVTPSTDLAFIAPLVDDATPSPSPDIE